MSLEQLQMEEGCTTEVVTTSFTDDQYNKLDHQIESYTATNGNFVAWVRIPSLSYTTNTVIKILYCNSQISTNPSVTTVWNTSYKGVWHLNGSDYNDATSTGNNGTNNATTDLPVGRIGGAKSFNGSTSYVRIPSNNGFVACNATQTISIWARYSSTPVGNQNLIAFQNTGASNATQLGFRGNDPFVWYWGGNLLVTAPSAPSLKCLALLCLYFNRT